MSTLKQPELGQTIAKLRQEKKLTQEELVERCNLNVRTLQRIETGDVTPRDYTIRSILTALDYNFEQIEQSITRKSSIRNLHMAWVAGIVFFASGIFETAVDYTRFDDYGIYFSFVYILVKAVVIISAIFFYLGFVEIGRMQKSSLLKIGTILLMGSWCLVEFYDIITFFSDMTSEEFLIIKGTEAVMFGGFDIIFGIALFRLGKELGASAKVAGIFEIIAGICLVSFILSLVGLFMLIPAIILEIIVLYKCYDKIQTEA